MTEVCPINNLEKMLLATDGSDFSSGAVSEAINLTGKCSSKLMAIAVVEANEEYASMAPGMVEKEEAKAGGALELVKTQAAEAGVDCEVAVHTRDRAWAVIVDEARNINAELIIMG